MEIIIYKAVNILTDQEVVGTKEELARITGISVRNVATYARSKALYHRKWRFYKQFDEIGKMGKCENMLNTYGNQLLEEWEKVRKDVNKALKVKVRSRKSGFRTPYNVMR